MNNETVSTHPLNEDVYYFHIDNASKENGLGDVYYFYHNIGTKEDGLDAWQWDDCSTLEKEIST